MTIQQNTNNTQDGSGPNPSISEKIDHDLAIYAHSNAFELRVTTETDRYGAILSKSDIPIDLAVLRQTIALNHILEREKELNEFFQALRRSTGAGQAVPK